MTTMEIPTVRSVLAMKLANSFARSATKRERKARSTNRVNAVLNATVRVVLHLAGFSALTFAGFTFSMAAGLIVGGISCFALSTLLTRNANDETEGNRAPDMRTGR